MKKGFSITEYHDAAAIIRQLDELIGKPIYTISPEALKRYEQEYYARKCKKSKAMIEMIDDVLARFDRVFANVTIKKEV